MTFDPDWASPPGESISESIEALGMSAEGFALAAGIPMPELLAVLREEDPAPITPDLACKLDRVMPGTRDFWLNLERIYRERLPRVAAIRERRRRTVFVSGHLDLTPEEFRYNYVPALDREIACGALFVVGDARGADQMAQDHLLGAGAEATVYHMLGSPRYNAGFPAVGGFESDDERDEAMTDESSRDIAWVRPGREDSGTQANLGRRRAAT